MSSLCPEPPTPVPSPRPTPLGPASVAGPIRSLDTGRPAGSGVLTRLGSCSSHFGLFTTKWSEWSEWKSDEEFQQRSEGAGGGGALPGWSLRVWVLGEPGWAPLLTRLPWGVPGVCVMGPLLTP